MKIKVGVIFGGRTVEHEVGIISALHAMEFFDLEKYEVIPIYLTKDNLWYTSDKLNDINSFKNLDNINDIAENVVLIKKNGEFVLKNLNFLKFKKDIVVDVIFPILHGKGVEDGVLAGHLKMIGIPFAAPDVIGASIGQDKAMQKLVLEASGILVPEYTWFYDTDFINNEKEIIKNIEKINYPVIIKPANLGSSIGIKIAKNRNELIDAINEAITYDSKIVIEQVIDNIREVDCAVIGNSENQEVSLVGEVMQSEEFFTFEEKYMSNGKKTGGSTKNSKMSSGFVFPADLPKKQVLEIQEISKKAFKVLNLRGVTRFDYLIDSKTNKIYLNEPNTIPGSLAFFFFSESGKSYTKLLDELIQLAIEEYKNDSKKTFHFDSNILSTFNGSKIKK